MCAHVPKGNILNKDDCKKAVKGIDSVFHTAAVIDYWSRFDFQRPLSYAVNVTGLEVHTPLDINDCLASPRNQYISHCGLASIVSLLVDECRTCLPPASPRV